MNPFPRGTTHARAYDHVAARLKADGSDAVLEANVGRLHEFAFEEFSARLAELRPVIDCSGDPVITKPEAAPGTQILPLIEAIAAGVRVEGFEPAMSGTFDQRQTLLDSFLAQRAVGEYAATRDAEAAQKAAKDAADAAEKAKAAAALEQAQLEADLKAWQAERRQKKAEG